MSRLPFSNPILALGWMLGLAAAIAFATPTRAQIVSTVDQAAAVQLIVKSAPGVKDAAGWARDMLAVFSSLRIDPSPANFCAVAAVVRQESGFAENPVVPGLGKKAEAAAIEEIAKSVKLQFYFTVFPEHRRMLLERLKAARTERDLDLAYRWLTGEIVKRWGVSFLVGIFGRGMTVDEYFEANNRIRTIGSMQVSVSFALRELKGRLGRKLTLDDAYAVREFLYSRKGGLYYGTLQLLGYEVDYHNKTFLFADYNAGRYSSRNAAFQSMVADLTGARLEFDGDLLAYSGQAPAKSQSVTEALINRLFSFSKSLDADQVRADLLHEKSYQFQETRTYRELRQLYQSRTHKAPPYAIVPRIELRNIKISRRFTTANFAQSVETRYFACERAFYGTRAIAQRDR